MKLWIFFYRDMKLDPSSLRITKIRAFLAERADNGTYN